jgi:hypothetical protein
MGYWFCYNEGSHLAVQANCLKGRIDDERLPYLSKKFGFLKRIASAIQWNYYYQYWHNMKGLIYLWCQFLTPKSRMIWIISTYRFTVLYQQKCFGSGGANYITNGWERTPRCSFYFYVELGARNGQPSLCSVFCWSINHLLSIVIVTGGENLRNFLWIARETRRYQEVLS